MRVDLTRIFVSRETKRFSRWVERKQLALEMKKGNQNA